jgi:hypothetical protein
MSETLNVKKQQKTVVKENSKEQFCKLHEKVNFYKTSRAAAFKRFKRELRSIHLN